MVKIEFKQKWFIEIILNETVTDNQILNLLKNSNNAQLRAISEIIFNFLQGNIPITREGINKLKKYSSILRKLSQKNVKRKYYVKHYKLIKNFLKIIEQSLFEII
jgi:hypothetical protein